MNAYLLVGLGGGLGSMVRFAIQSWTMNLTPVAAWFPAGTLLVNVSGCFVMGCIAVLLGEDTAREPYRRLLLTGFLGGYTTFSAFGWETLRLIEEQRLGPAAAYIGLSMVLGLAAVGAGYFVGRTIAALS